EGACGRQKKPAVDVCSRITCRVEHPMSPLTRPEQRAVEHLWTEPSEQLEALGMLPTPRQPTLRDLRGVVTWRAWPGLVIEHRHHQTPRLACYRCGNGFRHAVEMFIEGTSADTGGRRHVRDRRQASYCSGYTQ